MLLHFAAAVLRFTHYGKIAFPVVSCVPVLVMNVPAVALAGSLSLNHHAPSFVAPSPALLLARLLVVRVVFLSVVPSHSLLRQRVIS